MNEANSKQQSQQNSAFFYLHGRKIEIRICTATGGALLGPKCQEGTKTTIPSGAGWEQISPYWSWQINFCWHQGNGVLKQTLQSFTGSKHLKYFEAANSGCVLQQNLEGMLAKKMKTSLRWCHMMVLITTPFGHVLADNLLCLFSSLEETCPY